MSPLAIVLAPGGGVITTGGGGGVAGALELLLAELRTEEDLGVLAEVLVSAKFLLPSTKA